MLGKGGRVFRMPSKILHLVGVGPLIVKFVDKSLSRYPLSPLHVSKVFGTYGIAHDVSVPCVFDSGVIAWILVKGGRLPGAVWVL